MSMQYCYPFGLTGLKYALDRGAERTFHAGRIWARVKKNRWQCEDVPALEFRAVGRGGLQLKLYYRNILIQSNGDIIT